MSNKIEILAPAGSYEGMRAAMNAGCDAVYIGGRSFGARANANNLDEEDLLRAIDEAHIREKKLYLTVNTLLKERELSKELYPFLDRLYLQGLDAVIVQDVGVMHYIHRHFPKLPIHASTQTTVMMAEGAEILKSVGVTRTVTARELSLSEIKRLRQNTNLEIETFVHGALCYSYSGQCLMSSIIGGRSGNRGRCAQPCRMPYDLYADGKQISEQEQKYLLSPKDINTVALIPDLVDAGIDSFKIEGRMKRPEYAALVSYIYRKYTDLYFNIGSDRYKEYMKSDEFKADMRKLQDIYNRGGFSEGYFNIHHGKAMMSMYRPNHSGVSVGEVSSVKGNQVLIKLKAEIYAQDILEIRGQYESSYEFTVKSEKNAGEIISIIVGRIPNNKDMKQEIKRKQGAYSRFKIGDMVYRTKNNRLLDQLVSDYISTDRKQSISGLLSVKLGERMKLSLSAGNTSVTAYHNIVQPAVNQPIVKEKLITQMKKTGDTIYEFEKLEVDMDENIFVPLVWLNELRRDAIGLLLVEKAQQHRRSSLLSNKESTVLMNDVIQNQQLGICVLVHTKEQFELAMEFDEISSVYVEYDTFTVQQLLIRGEEAMKKGKKLLLSLPHVVRPKVYDKIKKDIFLLIESNINNGYLVKNFEEANILLELLEEGKINSTQIVLNHNMYIFNKESKLFWQKKGVKNFTAPLELNLKELKELEIQDCDFLVYGHIPLMITAQCLLGGSSGCDKVFKNMRDNYLQDRMKKKFFVRASCNACYNTIYNGQPLSLLNYTSEVLALKPSKLRLDFTIEKADEMRLILKAFIDAFYSNKAINQLKDYTTGHFKRGVE